MNEPFASRRAPAPSGEAHDEASGVGLRVCYDGLSGVRVAAEATDVTTAGVFVLTDRPLPIGKRIGMEIHLRGERSAIAAAGRVIEKRTTADPYGRPAGMRIKFIDVDEGALEVIKRLLEAEEASAGNARQRTMLGVAPAAPLAMVPPGRRAVVEPILAPTATRVPDDVVSAGGVASVDAMVDAMLEATAFAVASQPESEVRPMVVAVTSTPIEPDQTVPERTSTLEAISVAHEPAPRTGNRARRVIVGATLAVGLTALAVGYRSYGRTGDTAISKAPATAAATPVTRAEAVQAPPPTPEASLPTGAQAPASVAQKETVPPPVAPAQASPSRAPAKPHRTSPRKPSTKRVAH